MYVPTVGCLHASYELLKLYHHYIYYRARVAECQMGEPHGDESEQAFFSFFFVFEGRTFDDVNKNEQYP
jgi:hypothetical protein